MSRYYGFLHAAGDASQEKLHHQNAPQLWGTGQFCCTYDRIWALFGHIPDLKTVVSSDGEHVG
jgi:hypothetical protein